MANRSVRRPLWVFTLRATRRQGKVNLHYKRPKYNVAITSAEVTNLFVQSHLNTLWNCNLWSKESINDKHSWRPQVPPWMDPKVRIVQKTHRTFLTKLLNVNSLSWKYKYTAKAEIYKLFTIIKWYLMSHIKIQVNFALRKFNFIANSQYHDLLYETPRLSFVNFTKYITCSSESRQKPT